MAVAAALLSAALALWTGRAATAEPAVDAPKVAQIKAAYLVNFIRFTRWPEDAFADDDSPLVIGVLGEDALGTVLDRTVADERLHDRKVQVERLGVPRAADFRSTEAYEDSLTALRDRMRRVHLLYVAPARERDLRPVLEDFNAPTTLLVGDTRDHLKFNVALALHLERDRVVFYADPEATEQTSLTISSKLLRLARIRDRRED